MSKRKIIRAAILVAVLITSITGGTAVAQAADQYSAFTTEIATAETAYQQAADSLEQTVAEIPDNELLHAELKATAESALAEEPVHYELDPNLKQVLSVFNITPEYPIWQDQQQELHAWYDNQIESLKDTSADLKADHDAYVAQKEKEAAEAAARQKAAEQAAANTWTVSAVPSYGTVAAPADGSVGEWQPGYYIAHDWSANGSRIASKPAHVIVNGQVYHYVSSMVVPPDTPWASVSGFVYANGGIGFQTCVGSQRLITHYEPGE